MISADKARRIKAVILDIDGVLTDGRVGYGGNELIKFFHYRDGHWMKLALRAGIMVGLLSGRESRANRDLHWEHGVLATDHQGSPLNCTLLMEGLYGVW